MKAALSSCHSLLSTGGSSGCSLQKQQHICKQLNTSSTQKSDLVLILFHMCIRGADIYTGTTSLPCLLRQ